MIRFFPLILLSILLAACGGKDKKEAVKKKSLLPPTIAESKLEEFTGGRTKIVWTQPQNPDKVDKQGTSRHHFLMAIDTADGRGEHKVLEEKANYAYPIITPDGERIVFTRKVKVSKGDKRRFDVTTKKALGDIINLTQYIFDSRHFIIIEIAFDLYLKFGVAGNENVGLLDFGDPVIAVARIRF